MGGEGKPRPLTSAGNSKAAFTPSRKPHWGPAIPDLPNSEVEFLFLVNAVFAGRGFRGLPGASQAASQEASHGPRRAALQTFFLILVSMPDQGPVFMIQILRDMKLLQASRISLPPLLVAFPERLAPKLLQWCSTSDTFRSTLALPCLAQLLCNGELPTSGCCRNIMLRDLHRNLQK